MASHGVGTMSSPICISDDDDDIIEISSPHFVRLDCNADSFKSSEGPRTGRSLEGRDSDFLLFGVDSLPSRPKKRKHPRDVSVDSSTSSSDLYRPTEIKKAKNSRGQNVQALAYTSNVPSGSKVPNISQLQPSTTDALFQLNTSTKINSSAAPFERNTAIVDDLPPSHLSKRAGPQNQLPIELKPSKTKVHTIGVPLERDTKGIHGTFKVTQSLQIAPFCSGPLPYTPDPTRTLVMEQIPKNLRSADYIRKWCHRATHSDPEFIAIEPTSSKSLIGFSSHELAQKAWCSPRLAPHLTEKLGTELKGKPREDLIRVWWYLAPAIPTSYGEPRKELEDGEIDDVKPAKPLTKKERKLKHQMEERQRQKLKAQRQAELRNKASSTLPIYSAPVQTIPTLPPQVLNQPTLPLFSAVPIPYNPWPTSSSLPFSQNGTYVSHQPAPDANWRDSSFASGPSSHYVGPSKIALQTLPRSSVRTTDISDDNDMDMDIDETGSHTNSSFPLSTMQVDLLPEADTFSTTSTTQMFISQDTLMPDRPQSPTSIPPSQSTLPSSTHDNISKESMSRHSLAQQKELEERVTASKMEQRFISPRAFPDMVSNMTIVADISAPLNKHSQGEDNKLALEKQLRAMVLASQRKRVKPISVPLSADPVSTEVVSKSTMGDATAKASLQDLAESFITDTLQNFRPPSNAKMELEAKQRLLERQIAESKMLMAKLTQAKTKQDKDEILALMREKSRASTTEYNHGNDIAKRYRWPETLINECVLILSDDSADDEDSDDERD